MFNILGEDEHTITVEGPAGQPTVIAKAGMSPDMIQSLSQSMQASGGRYRAPSMADVAAAESAKPQVGGDYAGLNSGGMTQSSHPQVQVQPPQVAPQPQVVQVPNVSAAQEVAAQQPAASPEVPKPVQAAPISAFDKGINQQQQAVQAMGQNAYVEGAKKAAEYKGLSDQMAQYEKQRQDLEKRKAAESEQIQKQIQQASDEASKNVPDKDFWADHGGTAAKIGAAIAVGLGAMGASLTGGENQALKIINNTIEQDLKRQQQRYQAIRNKAGDLRDTYGLMLKRYGDQESAMLAMQEVALKRTQIKIQQFASQTESQDAKLKAQQLMGALEEKRGEAYNKLAAKQAERTDQMRASYVPHFGGYATNEKSAATINELAGATNSAKDNIRQLLTLANTPAKSVDPQVRAQADTTARMLQASLRVPVLGPGTVQENERKLLESIASDPTKIFSLDQTNRTRLNTLMDRLDANLMMQAKAYGLVPGGAQTGQATQRVGVPRQ
jgi:hypothetical protein